MAVKPRNPRKILVVEDTESAADPLVRLLRHAGHTPFWARDGKEALDVLDDVRPDLVMLDMMMPVLDGFGFLERVRSHPKWKDLPVIVLTGAGPTLDISRLSQLGVGEVLLKGAVDYHRLLHRLS